MRDYPPAHVIHEATCPDVPEGRLAFRASALIAFPNSRPHHCFSSATVAANRRVVAEPGRYDDHLYAPSTIFPPDAPRALCKVCRGTHGTQFGLPLTPALGLE